MSFNRLAPLIFLWRYSIQLSILFWVQVKTTNCEMKWWIFTIVLVGGISYLEVIRNLSTNRGLLKLVTGIVIIISGGSASLVRSCLNQLYLPFDWYSWSKSTTGLDFLRTHFYNHIYLMCIMVPTPKPAIFCCMKNVNKSNFWILFLKFNKIF